MSLTVVDGAGKFTGLSGNSSLKSSTLQLSPEVHTLHEDNGSCLLKHNNSATPQTCGFPLAPIQEAPTDFIFFFKFIFIFHVSPRHR